MFSGGGGMARCWSEIVALVSRPAGLLTRDEYRYALAFARLAQNIYPDQTKGNRGDAALVLNWIEILQPPKTRSRGINMGAVHTFMRRCTGFNAARYKLRHKKGLFWVLSFEGIGSLMSLRGLPDWLLNNIPATLNTVGTGSAIWYRRFGNKRSNKA